MSIDRIRRLARHVGALVRLPDATENHLERIAVLQGQQLALALRDRPIKALDDVEFRVCSQFGDDGIIQYLAYHLAIPRERQWFVEFGVEQFTEANCRFLMLASNWRGLILDGSAERLATLDRDPIGWRHDLRRQAAWIDRDNIDHLIRDAGVPERIGLLSIDIDGNDYWVWERLQTVAPDIVVAEYNALFGPNAAVTVPYDPAFRRFDAHASGLYFGASLAALEHLARRKGLVFVGCASAGHNAYFVREELWHDRLPRPTLAAGFRPATFRQARQPDGSLSRRADAALLAEIGHLPVVDVTTGGELPLGPAMGAK